MKEGIPSSQYKTVKSASLVIQPVKRIKSMENQTDAAMAKEDHGLMTYIALRVRTR